MQLVDNELRLYISNVGMNIAITQNKINPGDNVWFSIKIISYDDYTVHG